MNPDYVGPDLGRWVHIRHFTEVVDVATNFASDKFTAPVPGVYDFSVVGFGSSIASDEAVLVNLRVNGSTDAANNTQIASWGTGSANSSPPLSGSCAIPLAAGDYVEVFARVYGTTGRIITVHRLTCSLLAQTTQRRVDR